MDFFCRMALASDRGFRDVWLYTRVEGFNAVGFGVVMSLSIVFLFEGLFFWLGAVFGILCSRATPRVGFSNRRPPQNL